jgi:hypothetical protein
MPLPSYDVAKIVASFNDYFRFRNVTFPEKAANERLDGAQFDGGWIIRWRWREDGLEVLAHHRMTNSRWFSIDPQGKLHNRSMPDEGYSVSGSPEEREAAMPAYQQSWQEHRLEVEARGMDAREILGADREPNEFGALDPNVHRPQWRADNSKPTISTDARSAPR